MEDKTFRTTILVVLLSLVLLAATCALTWFAVDVSSRVSKIEKRPAVTSQAKEIAEQQREIVEMQAKIECVIEHDDYVC